MHKILLFLASCLVLQLAADRTVDSHLSAADLERFQGVFGESMLSDDLQTIYYAASNVQDIPTATKERVCKNLLSLYESSKLNDFEKKFYAIGIHTFAKCTIKLPDDFRATVAAALQKDSTTTQEIYFNFLSAKSLGVAIDKTTTEKLTKNLQAILKKDDSLNSLGYAFHVAADLGTPAAFVTNRIEDAIVQADEVDGKMLQFEGGLSITGLIVNGIFKVAKAYNKPAPLSVDQAVKFSAYFLSRRSVITSKGAHVLLSALKTIASATDVAPICIQNVGNGQLQAESPTINIKVVNLLGSPLASPPSNIYGKVLHKSDKSVLAEKVTFASRSSDKTVFSADLSTYKPARGAYTVDVTADKFKQTLAFKVLGKVKVQSLEVSVGDSDLSSAAKKRAVNFPTKLAEPLIADGTQSIYVKAVLSDEATNKVIQVQQAFIRMSLKQTDEEIVFIADQDAARAYKFYIDFGRGADFKFKTGEYSLELIVGDSSLSNSFRWHLADVNLTVRKDKDVKPSQLRHQMLPEIKHIFREPEKRPSILVSNSFTLIALAPLLLLFILWAKIGINVSAFSFRPSVLLFHTGFAAILGIFGLFWLQLNMFQTLRLLVPAAIVTFLAGNRLLARIAADKAKSP